MEKKALGTSPVTLFFEGMMVGRFNAGVFEMGILPVPGHSFTITIEEGGPVGVSVKQTKISIDEELTSKKVAWRLGVDEPKRKPDAELHQPLPKKPDRKVPPDETDLDFRWTVDLASDEFPNHAPKPSRPKGKVELPRFSGLLKPVLRITTGLFYARKIATPGAGYYLHRRQGMDGKYEPFGYTPEQIAADLRKLKAGQDVVLKLDDKDEEIFRLKVKEGKQYRVFFRNTPPNEAPIVDGFPTQSGQSGGPPDMNRPTHFHLFYLLFNVPPQKRYELRYVPSKEVDDKGFLLSGNREKLISKTIEEVSAMIREIRSEEKRTGRPYGVPTGRCAPGMVTSENSLVD